MFEHYKQPLLSSQGFIMRMLRCAGTSLIVLSGTIITGTLSFHYLEDLAWIDAFLNSVLIMTGLGTVSIINTAAGKIFTSIYAIFSSLAFFGVIVILVAPILHRLLHYFRLDIDGQQVER
jgi:hypothetical protein